MESHKGLFNLEIQAVSSVHTQVSSGYTHKHNNMMTVFFWLTVSLSFMHTSRVNINVHTQTTTSVHSAIVRHQSWSFTCSLSCYICFSVSFIVPVSLCIPLLPLQVPHCNKPPLFCIRTTTWSVSSPSATHWRVVLRSRCGSERRRFQRTSWSMS